MVYGQELSAQTCSTTRNYQRTVSTLDQIGVMYLWCILKEVCNIYSPFGNMCTPFGNMCSPFRNIIGLICNPELLKWEVIQ
jgi:hypothetical protein